MNLKNKNIAILRWDQAEVPVGLMQLSELTGNSTNENTYPFDVKLVEIKGANSETIIFNPNPKILSKMIETAKNLVEIYGVKAIATSCGFNAIHQKKLASAVNVPVFSSSLLQVPLVSNLIGTEKTVAIITAKKTSLTKKHLIACGISDEIKIIIIGLEDAPEWGKIFKNPNEAFDLEIVRKEIINIVKDGIRRDSNIGAIVLECTDLPPFANIIRKETGLPVFDFTTLAGYVGMGIGIMSMFESEIKD